MRPYHSPFVLSSLAFISSVLLASAPAAHAGPLDPNRIDEAFEGVYNLKFDCVATHDCPPEASVLEKLVILGTGKPALLGGGLGLVVTLVNPINGPAFTFFQAEYDEAQGTIHAEAAGGSGQVADLNLTLDPVTGGLVGKLNDSLSAGLLSFHAVPVRTTGSFFPTDGDAIAGPDVEGQYVGEWAGYPSHMLLKDMGGTSFAGNLIIDGSSPILTAFHGGLLDSKKGFLTLVTGYQGALLKIYAVNHGGQWSGYSISSKFGNFADLKLKKK